MRTEVVSGVVTKNDDPEKRGRIKIKSLELLADDTTEYPAWIEPAMLWGWFIVPDIGEEVAIEIELSRQQAESPEQGWLESPRMRWRGVRYESQQGEAPRPPHERFTEASYGKRRGFATPAGHVLLFDDTEGQEQITLSWAQGDKSSVLALSKDGSAILGNANGSSLYLNATDKLATLIDEHGNSIALSETAISIIDTHNNSIELKDGVVTVLGNNDVLVTAGSNVVVDAGSDVELKAGVSVKIEGATDVQLGPSADSPAMRHTDWLAWAAAHTHTAPAGGGATTPPVTPPTAAIASTKVKLK